MISMVEDILSVADSFDVVKIIDTDSIFVKLGDQKDLKAKILEIETFVNGSMIEFMDMHRMNRDDFIKMWLKNEFYIERIIAYSKKRYVASTLDVEKDKKKIEIKGIEGKRATTKYVVDIVAHLQKYISSSSDDIDLKDIFYDVFNKIEESIKNYDIGYISMPVNPPRSFDELKSVQSPARGMMNFDIIITEVFGKMFSKAYHYPINISPKLLSENQNLRSLCQQVIDRYENMDSIKLTRLKRDTDEDFISKQVKDMSIPEILLNSKTMNQLETLGIRIDFESILKTFFKKFLSLFSPVFEKDPNFNFIKECKKVHKHVLDTYYI